MSARLPRRTTFSRLPFLSACRVVSLLALGFAIPAQTGSAQTRPGTLPQRGASAPPGGAGKPNAKPELPPDVQRAAAAFQRAVTLHRARKVKPAIAAYNEFLRLATVARLPASAQLPAYQNLAVLYQYSGDSQHWEVALRHIASAQPNDSALWSRLAALAAGRRATTQASSDARRALALAPPPAVAAAAHYVLGMMAETQGQHGVGERELAQVTRLTPENPQGWYEYGMTLGREKKYRPAIAALERAGKLAPAFAVKAQPVLAFLKQQTNDRKGALAAYSAELKANPKDATAAFNRALLLQQAGKTSEAILAYQRALALDPGNAAAHANIGDLYYNSGNATAARVHYTQALAAHPRDPRLLTTLALSEMQEAAAQPGLPERERYYGLAESHIKAARRLDPKNPRYDDDLANIYVRMGRFDDALTLARARQTARPDDPAVYQRIADLYTMQRRADDVVKTWQAYRVRKPEDPLSYEQAALVYDASDKPDRALVERRALLARNPEPAIAARTFVGVGQNLARMKRSDEARKAFQAALALDPSGSTGQTDRDRADKRVRIARARLDAQRGLAAIADSEGKTDEAAQWLNQVKTAEAATAAKTNALPPADTYNAIARLYEKANRPAQVLAEYRALAQARPNDPAPLASLARYQDEQKHLDEAVAAYREAIGRAAPDPKAALDYRLQVAELYRKSGKLDDAITEYEAARRDYPMETRLLSPLAEIYQLKGDDDHALATYEILERLDPTLSWVADRKATIFTRQKRYAQAIALYEKRAVGDPEEYQTYIDLQRAYELDGRPGAYLPWLTARLQKNPQSRTLMAALIDEYGRQKRDAEGWTALQGVADHAAKNRDVQLAYADTLARHGKGKDALPVYRRIAALKPNDLNAQLTLASQLDTSENSDEANAVFEALIARPGLTDTQRLELRRQAAERYRRQNKTADAIRQYQAIVKTTPESDTYSRAALAFLLAYANRDAEAIPLYEGILKHNEVNPQVRASIEDELAGIAEKQSRKPDAVAHYQAALKLYPGDKRATAALQKLTAK